MPKWNPGKQGGKAVDVYFVLPIRFKLAGVGEAIPKTKNNTIIEVDGKTISAEEFAKFDRSKIDSIVIDQKVIITTKK